MAISWPALFPPATLERIRSASDIVEIIGQALPLKRAGANFVALCPFHKEKSPSFNINPHRQIFHCFGCHKGGDVFTFIKEYENIGFMDAVRRLADRAKIPLELDNQPGVQEARHLKDKLLLIHEQITQRWQSALANDAGGQIARDYLARRGVSEEAVRLFRLGYAPEAWDDTVNWAKSKNFEPEVMEQSGLIVKKEETGRHYDRFRGRLMFPICDEQGRVIGFSGRILSGDENTAKYVNSPETAIFTKGKVFFGLDKSKRALLDSHSAIVCEGQLDLIACFMAGVQNVIAPQGTALTSDHARILKRYVEEVVLCFDSDNAGQKAAVRSLDSLLAAGLAIRVATVPSPHDPDSFIKENGGEAFRELVQRAEGFFDYYLHRLCLTNDLQSDKGRLAVVKAMAEAVQKTNSNVLLDTYAQKTAMRLGVAADAVRKEFKKTPRPERETFEPESIEEENAEPTRPSEPEMWFLKLFLQKEDAVEWIAAHLDLKWIPHPTVRQIISSRIEACAGGDGTSVAGWVAEIEDDYARRLVTEALADDRVIRDTDTVLKGGPGKPGVVQTLRNEFIERRLKELQQAFSRPDLTVDDLRTLADEQKQLRNLKQQPLTPLADDF